MKKLFFNYSDGDKQMTEDLCLHFAVLGSKVDIWHKELILPGDDRDVVKAVNLETSDAAIHLLSADFYDRNDDCVRWLDKGIELQKKNIPVLLRSVDWEHNDQISGMEAALLPEDHLPLQRRPDIEEVYSGIVRKVAADVLGMPQKVRFNQRPYYYLLALLSIAAGAGLAYEADKIFDNLLITLGIFSLSLITALFILRKVIFPTGVSTHKA